MEWRKCRSCALIGAWLSYDYVYGHKDYLINKPAAIALAMAEDDRIVLYTWLFWIAVGTLAAALSSAFIFTWLKAKKQGMPIWGHTARRLMINVSIPLIAGGIFCLNFLKPAPLASLHRAV